MLSEQKIPSPNDHSCEYFWKTAAVLQNPLVGAHGQ